MYIQQYIWRRIHSDLHAALQNISGDYPGIYSTGRGSSSTVWYVACCVGVSKGKVCVHLGCTHTSR